MPGIDTQNNEVQTFELFDKNPKLSKDAIDELNWFVFRSKQIFSDLLITFQRRELGFPLVYGLDFDIIFSYANPWSREAYQSRLVRFVIEQDETPYIILPGTLEELTRFISFTEQKKIQSERLVYTLKDKGASPNTIKTARHLCKSAGIDNEFPNLGTEASSTDVNKTQIAEALLQATDRYVIAIKRAQRIVHSKRCLDLDNIFPKLKLNKHWIDEQVTPIAEEMYQYRRDMQNNIPDAKNLATIAHYTNQQAAYIARYPDERPPILRLLTNTKCLFKMRLEKQYTDFYLQQMARTDDSTINDVGHIFAVRSCTEAAIAAAIRGLDSDPTIWRNKSFEYKQSIERLREILSRIDNEARNFIYAGDFNPKRLAKALDDLSRFEDGEFTVKFITSDVYLMLKQLLLEDEFELKNKNVLEMPVFYNDYNNINQISSDLIPENIREHSMSKVIVLEDDEELPLITKEKYTFSSTDVLYEDDGNIDTSILHISDKKMEYIIKIDYHDDILYVEWETDVLISEVISLIGQIFDKDNGIIEQCGLKYEGELLITTCNAMNDEDPIINGICNLPLNQPPFLEDTIKINNLPNSIIDFVPLDFRCDTSICFLRVDISPIDGNPGILFAFKDIQLLPVLFEILNKTNSYGKIEECIQLIENKINYLISKKR